MASEHVRPLVPGWSTARLYDRLSTGPSTLNKAFAELADEKPCLTEGLQRPSARTSS
jgi:hypothetical protein